MILFIYELCDANTIENFTAEKIHTCKEEEVMLEEI